MMQIKNANVLKLLDRIRKRITITVMDIQKTLQDIADTGMTDAEIGLEIGAAQSIVTRLRNGTHKTTDFERGKKIEELAKKRKLKLAA